MCFVTVKDWCGWHITKGQVAIIPEQKVLLIISRAIICSSDAATHYWKIIKEIYGSEPQTSFTIMTRRVNILIITPQMTVKPNNVI